MSKPSELDLHVLRITHSMDRPAAKSSPRGISAANGGEAVAMKSRLRHDVVRRLTFELTGPRRQAP